MRLFLDNTTKLLVPGPDQRGSVATAGNPLAVMGGVRTPVELQFLDVDPTTGLQVPVRKPLGYSIYWGLKAVGDFEGPDFICSVLSFTRPETDDGFYVGWLSTNNSAVKAALRIDGTRGNDLPNVQLAGELNVKDPAAADPDKSAQYLYLLVQDWYAQGSEGVPASGSPAYPMPSELVTSGSLAGILGRVASGSVTIPSGQSYVDVAFADAFADATWRFQGLIVQKLSGTPGNILPGIVTNRTAAGFRVQLTGDTDATDYTLEYNVTTLPAAGLGFFAEAPTGGLTYGRRGSDGTWQALGDVAFTAASAYATAAQGAKADSALQPAGNGSALTALNATELISGTIPAARLPATLPAIDGTALAVLTATIAPTINFPGSVPASFYGDISVGMASPAAWGSTSVGGVTFKIPLYS